MKQHRIASTAGTAFFRRMLLLLARTLGLFALSRRLTASHVRILGYHGIWLGPGHFGNYLFMSEATFARRLDYLSRKGYPVISLDAAVQGLKTGDLPAAATVITIDDGWYGSYRGMFPLLWARGYPATVYLTTYHCVKQSPVADVMVRYWSEAVDPVAFPVIRLPDCEVPPLSLVSPDSRERARRLVLEHLYRLDDDRCRQHFLKTLYDHSGLDYPALVQDRVFHLLSEQEVRRAEECGIAFELHTHRHRTRLTGRNCLEQELRDNRACLRDLVGREGRHFCYPSGDYSPDQWSDLERAGIASATTTDAGLVTPQTHPYAMPRILDGEEVSDLAFDAEMSGFMTLARRALKAKPFRTARSGRAALAAPPYPVSRKT